MRKVKEGVMPGRSVLTFDLHLRASGIISRNDVSKHGRISFHLKLLDSVSEKGLDFFFASEPDCLTVKTKKMQLQSLDWLFELRESHWPEACYICRGVHARVR